MGMTREQAINSLIVHGFSMEQVGEIIKAVTPQEPLDGDYISREKVKEILRSGVSLDTDEDKDYICGLIDKLPSRK